MLTLIFDALYVDKKWENDNYVTVTVRTNTVKWNKDEKKNEFPTQFINVDIPSARYKALSEKGLDKGDALNISSEIKELGVYNGSPTLSVTAFRVSEPKQSYKPNAPVLDDPFADATEIEAAEA